MFKTAQEARKFATAGNAIVTLESAKTGQHFTYRLRQLTDKQDNPISKWFVSLLTGQNNESDYNYIGLLDDSGFRLTAKSKASEDAPSVKGFKFFWNHVSHDHLPENLIVHHEGRCGRCARKLTVPESIESGYGPECIHKIGG
jgi:hypothetical protein